MKKCQAIIIILLFVLSGCTKEEKSLDIDNIPSGRYQVIKYILAGGNEIEDGYVFGSAESDRKFFDSIAEIKWQGKDLLLSSLIEPISGLAVKKLSLNRKKSYHELSEEERVGSNIYFSRAYQKSSDIFVELNLYYAGTIRLKKID